MPDATDTTAPTKDDPTKGHSAGPFFVVKDTVITTDCDEDGNPDCPVDKRAWIGEFYGANQAADAAFAVRAMTAHDRMRLALATIQAWRGYPSDGPMEQWERIAALFHDETGFMRPGKDIASRSHMNARDCQLAWDRWVEEKNKMIDSMIDCALKLARGDA